MIRRDLFAAIWRLEHQGGFTLLPDRSLAFPVADFLQIDDRCLSVCVFNFVGVDSALPHYLLELAMRNSAFAGFVVIFNEQFYRLLYEVWKKTHPLANQVLYQRLISCCLGFHEQSPLSSYADCLVLQPSRVSLQQCLQRLLGVIPFFLTEYRGYWFDVETVSGLGAAAQLNNCLLGRRFFAAHYAMDCIIGPVPEGGSVDLSVLQELLLCFSVEVEIKLTVIYDDSLLRLGANYLGKIRLATALRPREGGDPGRWHYA